MGNQRKLYQTNSLPEDRVQHLVSIDFDFTTPEKKRLTVTELWESHYKDLEAFNDENGHCEVPSTYDPQPALYKWVSLQRTKYHKGKLQDDQIGKIVVEYGLIC